eukprot:evm.model.scf_46EXC.6 EVM.evm.TU.scf_46EXC.6   scf_46EXC:20674-21401(+)
MESLHKPEGKALFRLYHSEQQFSCLGNDAYNAIVRLWDQFNKGTVAGYTRVSGRLEAKRYSYRESRNIRLTAWAEEHKLGSDEERDWHKGYMDGLEEGIDFFPYSIAKACFTDFPGT